MNTRFFELGDIVELQSPLYLENPVGMIVEIWSAPEDAEGWQGTEVEWWTPQVSKWAEWPQHTNSRHLGLYLPKI